MVKKTLAFILGLSIACGPSAFADDYPNRPITIVVGFGVGGSADRMTRAMSSYIADAIGQPVQVINKRGAGTLLAANYVLDQPHDGYTVFASGFSPYLSNTILEGNADYTIEDFAYLNFQWFDEDLIALNKDSEYESLPDLLEDIRENPKTVRGAVVSGSGGHLIAKLLLEVSGIPQENLNLVAYNSGGLARAGRRWSCRGFHHYQREGVGEHSGVPAPARHRQSSAQRRVGYPAADRSDGADRHSRAGPAGFDSRVRHIR